MDTDLIRQNLKTAHSLVAEMYGENPPPEIVAAVLNSISTQAINAELRDLGETVCRAAAVAAGN